MATMILTYAPRKGWREQLRSLVHLLLNFQHHPSNYAATSSTCEEFTEFEKAIRILRMAANPGESYEITAARIEQEAERYQSFLRDPQPIGKIALKIKEVNSERTIVGSSREQYQVNDPCEGVRDKSEGKASVCYTLNRLNDSVLEFIVHDSAGNPIFPIARTYSNWIGDKEFDLGLGRTFYLTMVEGEPGYVKVQAGFVPPIMDQEKPMIPLDEDKVRALAARAGGRPAQKRNSFFSPFGISLACLLGAESVVVSLICCAAFWGLIPNSFGQQRATKDFDEQTQGATPPNARVAMGSYARNVDLNSPVGIIQAGYTVHPANTAGAFPQRNVEYARKTKRLAKIDQLSISVDHSSCQQGLESCGEMLTSFRQEVQSKLKFNLSSSLQNYIDVSAPSARLLVSFQPVDLSHGRFYLTLSDTEGVLWDDSTDVKYSQNDLLEFVGSYSDEASQELLWQINMAKDCSSYHEEKGSDSITQQ